jgi:hypothetical protein
MTATPSAFYQSQMDDFSKKLKKLNQTILQISILRISLFLAGIVAVYLAAVFVPAIVWPVSVLFGFSFIAVVVWHVRLHRTKDEWQRMLTINENELKTLSGDYSYFDHGGELSESGHPFVADLDIFGEGSIFQYINRTATKIGKQQLAGWFLQPEQDVGVIGKRHDAIRCLRGKIHWRQQWQSVGMRLEDAKDDKDQIIRWMKLPGEFGSKWFTFSIFAIPPVSLLMLILLITGAISFQLLVFYLMVPLGLAFSQSKKIGSSHEMLGKKAGMLRKYGELIRMIENEDFHDGALHEIKRSLTREHQAGKALRQLAAIIQAFDTRLNMFGWILLNYFVPYDILQARRLENWRRNFNQHAGEWFGILAQFDALISLSNLWYNRPEFILPEPVEGLFHLTGENCGHPLLNTKNRVDNPVSFDGFKQFIIVTGANMAGKSTYLRTVAINYMLAMAGAPVCAAQFRFTPVGIFTSLRTSDSLLQNESYFFAELKRLKSIIDKLQAGEKLFIVLDEILKGTNSRDKQEGSKALLRQLIRYNASGLIATHDLSLGELINDYPLNIRNKRFEVEIVNDELVFDYQLKEGISQNLNASFLMKKMGITG